MIGPLVDTAMLKVAGIALAIGTALVLGMLGYSAVQVSRANAKAAQAGQAAATARAEMQVLRADVAASAAESSETAREREQKASQANARLNDELHQVRIAGAAERAAVERRLRERTEQARTSDGAASAGSASAGTGQQLDAAPLACLSDAARGDLVSLASDANDTARDLAACQRYVSEVVPLCQPADTAAP